MQGAKAEYHLSQLLIDCRHISVGSTIVLMAVQHVNTVRSMKCLNAQPYATLRTLQITDQQCWNSSVLKA